MSGSKMARSEGNIALVGDLIERGVSARALRYALISAHYRTGLSWSEASLTAAAAAIERLDAVLAALATYREDRPDDPTLPAVLEAGRTAFGAALDDDLNVSPALAALFDLVRELNRRIDARSLSTADAGRGAAVLAELDDVLGIGPDTTAERLDPSLQALLDARADARQQRDWAAADRLRDELAEAGIAVEDSRDGQRWRRIGATVDG
jgi:cysteinyl-tRNA synthetase